MTNAELQVINGDANFVKALLNILDDFNTEQEGQRESQKAILNILEDLVVTVEEREVTRKKLAVTAKQLAVTAEKREEVRLKLATTAENLRLQAEELEIKNVRLANMVDASLAFGQNLNHNDLLTLIVESARTALGCRYAALGVMDKTHKELAEFVTSGLSDEEKATIGSFPQGKGLLGEIINDPRTIRLTHLADDQRSVGFPPHHPPMDSFLGVPIDIAGTVFGNLYFTEKVDGSFTAEDEQLANAFASQAAIAIGSMNRHEAALRTVKMLESVREIEHVIRESFGIQEILDILCVSLGELFGVDRVIIKTVDIENHALLNAQWYLPDLQPVSDQQIEQFPHVGNLADELWNSSSVLVQDDYLAPAAQADEGAQKFQRITGARSSILSPIGLDQKVLGIIYVITVHQPRHWDNSEIDILREIATFATQSIVEHGFKVHQQEYIARLERLDRQKTNFVATVSHELRTPLTSITGYLELLEDGVAGDLTSEQRKMLDVIDRNSIRLSALIENLLAINRSEITDSMVVRTQISIHELINSVCEEFLPLAQSRNIQFEINSGPDAAIVLGDRVQLKSAVANIVSNAIKFSHVDGVVTMSSSLNNETRMIEIICQDHGVGIPVEDQENLFTQFFRASNATDLQIPGTGLGLTIVKRIIHDHGGEVRLGSVEGKGTTVIIDLPLAPVEVAPNLK